MIKTDERDPLAVASAKPDVSALIEEFTYAMENGPAQVDTLAAAEDTRLNRWAGKSPERDGCLWQRNQPSGKIVRPYDGRPDTDVNLCDEIVLTETDVDCMAFEMAQIGADTTHVTQLTAAQSAELKAMARWIRKATSDDMADGVELLSQMKGSIGWCVLHTGWREKWGLTERTVTMEELVAAANRIVNEASGATPDATRGTRVVPEDVTAHPLVQLPLLIVDETLEAEAVELVQQIVPHLTKKSVRKIVRSLRTEGEAVFLDRQLEFKGPYMQVLIPGVDVFMSGGGGDAQKARGWLRVEFFYEADLRAMQLNGGWNEDFIEAACGTAGQVSSQGKALRANQPGEEANDRRIEIWTAEVRQFDPETGATGIYCTTFSPHLSPGDPSREARAGAPEAGALPETYYAKHYLLDYAHGQYPYVICRREVIGPGMSDSRGVPEMVRADQAQIKRLQDAQGMRAHWEVNPAMIRVGSGWSKVKQPLAPGAELDAPPGGDVKGFALDRGNPQVAAVFINNIEKGTRRRFALPNSGEDGGHPSLWQMRQGRQTNRFLTCFRRAYTQLAVLCYQEFNAEELAQIIGRAPMLSVSDLLRCHVTMKFETRALDSDWVKTVLGFITQMMTWDKGGLIDTAPLIRIGMSYIDTTIGDEVLRSPQGAQAQLYRKVEQDVAGIMLGNPPPMVEMDASAGMQLDMAFSVVGKNQKFQQVLQRDEQTREHFKTYLENLKHSQQETELSPVQGRLGVAEMPQKPVQRGNAMAMASY
jgi:hypothetical protein